MLSPEYSYLLGVLYGLYGLERDNRACFMSNLLDVLSDEDYQNILKSLLDQKPEFAYAILTDLTKKTISLAYHYKLRGELIGFCEEVFIFSGRRLKNSLFKVVQVVTTWTLPLY